MFVRETNLNPSKMASALASQFADFSWIDSAHGEGFSVLAFDSTDCMSFTADTPPDLFRGFLNLFHVDQRTGPVAGHARDLSFSGGWIGFMAYEAFAFNPLIPLTPKKFKPYPLAQFRYYDTFFYIDHQHNKTCFISRATDAAKKWQRVEDIIRTHSPPTTIKLATAAATVRIKTAKEEYTAAFAEIQRALHNGDYFELNYTLEFASVFSGDPLALYLTLRSLTRAPMMCYLSSPNLKVLSSSPERFFKIDAGEITASPIKGTIGRGRDVFADADNRQRLANSNKDRAELLMVTDMLRNDLGRVCETGSVATRHLARLESFSHCHHLVSEITGRLKKDATLFDVFTALFPGGSITGAPKIKVMQHIDALESRARGIYTGAIGFMSNCGRVDFNIPIRTLTLEGDALRFATGGGIVADSDVVSEYEECLVKAQGILAALKSFYSGESNLHVAHA